jgi:hypothetical protein
MRQRGMFQMSFPYSGRLEMFEPRALSHTFYEFFAGSGMVRAGLGGSWTCLFANDCDEKKAA